MEEQCRTVYRDSDEESAGRTGDLRIPDSGVDGLTTARPL